MTIMKKLSYQEAPSIKVIQVEVGKIMAAASTGSTNYDLGGDDSGHQETGEVIPGDGPGHNDAKRNLWTDDEE